MGAMMHVLEISSHQHLARTDLGIGIAANQPAFPAPSWPFLAEMLGQGSPRFHLRQALSQHDTKNLGHTKPRRHEGIQRMIHGFDFCPSCLRCFV